MSADVVAAATGTLRDLDAALAAHEADQAVAWLDEMWTYLTTQPCTCGCRSLLTPREVLASSHEPDVVTYRENVASGQIYTNPMAEVLMPPGAYLGSDDEILWNPEPTYESARWPHDFRWSFPDHEPEPAPAASPPPSRLQQRYGFMVGVSLTAASVTGT